MEECDFEDFNPWGCGTQDCVFGGGGGTFTSCTPAHQALCCAQPRGSPIGSTGDSPGRHTLLSPTHQLHTQPTGVSGGSNYFPGLLDGCTGELVMPVTEETGSPGLTGDTGGFPSFWLQGTYGQSRLCASLLPTRQSCPLGPLGAEAMQLDQLGFF